LSILIDHIKYIVRLVGVDYVGLESDFDGIDSAPKELNGVEDFPKITDALLERGYSVKDIDKILGGNFLRVLRANENGLSDGGRKLVKQELFCNFLKPGVCQKVFFQLNIKWNGGIQ
jgi:hypothetical protein